jgi:hypothetical protein
MATNTGNGHGWDAERSAWIVERGESLAAAILESESGRGEHWSYAMAEDSMEDLLDLLAAVAGTEAVASFLSTDATFRRLREALTTEILGRYNARDQESVI